MGSFLADSSVHLAGNGRNLFTFLFGVLQPGTGHLEVTNDMPWISGLVHIQPKRIIRDFPRADLEPNSGPFPIQK